MNLFKAMHLFVLIVDRGSLTAAANEQKLSTTMVGNHLKALETHLGMTLLNRTTRRQHLTEFGVDYYARCVEILARVEESQAMAQAAVADPSGQLRVSVPLAFGVDQLMPALTDYTRHHPRVSLDISVGDRLVNLVDEGFEAAIRIGKPQEAGWIARPLRSQRLACCASSTYLEARGTPRCPSDLAAHDCLLYSYKAGATWRSPRREWKLRDSGSDIVVPVGGLHQADNAPALRRMALADMGIVLLPEALVAEDIAAGTLVSLLQDNLPPPRPLHLLYLPTPYPSPKLKSFVDFVIGRFGQ
ncbi:LysR family transcriptional regulator [Salinicola halophyticus]|uniref:LysR family transcriptional regulator n=1 Tax=Salinicola halophyticus TaxID=1808881 RepID=UPI003F6E2F24